MLVVTAAVVSTSPATLAAPSQGKEQNVIHHTGVRQVVAEVQRMWIRKSYSDNVPRSIAKRLAVDW